MKQKLGIISWLFVALLSACATPPSPTIISFAGQIDIPVVVQQKKVWLDDGPLIVVSTDPLISYRAINQNEIAFAGSDKTVADFFSAVYNHPTSAAEQSLAESFAGYQKSFSTANGLHVFTYSGNDEIKTYITSEQLNIGVEIYISGSANAQVLREIIRHVAPTQGD